MKNNIIVIMVLAFLLPCIAQGQNKSVDDFYRKYKHLEGSHNAKLPGVLFKMGSKIAKNKVDDEESKEALEMAKVIKKVKTLFVEEGHKVDPKDIKGLVKGLKSEAYEELITIRETETRINIMIRGDELNIKNIFVLVSDPEEMILLDIKVKLSYDDINRFIKLMKEDIEMEIETPDEVLPQV